MLIEVDHKTEIIFSNINWVLTGWYHNAQIIFFDHLTGFRDSTRIFQISVNLSEIIETVKHFGQSSADFFEITFFVNEQSH